MIQVSEEKYAEMLARIKKLETELAAAWEEAAKVVESLIPTTSEFHGVCAEDWAALSAKESVLCEASAILREREKEVAK